MASEKSAKESKKSSDLSSTESSDDDLLDNFEIITDFNSALTVRAKESVMPQENISFATQAKQRAKSSDLSSTEAKQAENSPEKKLTSTQAKESVMPEEKIWFATQAKQGEKSSDLSSAEAKQAENFPEKDLTSTQAKESVMPEENISFATQWKVADLCRARYPGDNRMYEARITKIIDDDYCTVVFLGYEDENDFEVTLKSLARTYGMKAIKKQIKYALRNNEDTDYDKSTRFKDSVSSQTPGHPHSKRRHHKHDKQHMRDYGANFPNFDSLSSNYDPDPQDTDYGNCTKFKDSVSSETPGHPHSRRRHHKHDKQHMRDYGANFPNFDSLSSNYDPDPQMPPAPPLPQCSEIVGNPDLNEILLSWYMSGYHSGLYQAQKNPCLQKCCKSSHRP